MLVAISTDRSASLLNLTDYGCAPGHPATINGARLAASR